jgi:hypothetical protein
MILEAPRDSERRRVRAIDVLFSKMRTSRDVESDARGRLHLAPGNASIVRKKQRTAVCKR